MKKTIIIVSLLASFTLLPTVVSAQSVSELQERINALMAQLNQLKKVQSSQAVTESRPVPVMAIPAQGDAPPGGDVSSCVVLQNDMGYRSTDLKTDGEVSALQDFLQSNGYLGGEPTGFFGQATLKAIKIFQRASGLSPTGYVGQLTRGKIKDATCGGTKTPTTVSVVKEAPTAPALMVISPNGGGYWYRNSSAIVEWKTVNIPEDNKMLIRLRGVDSGQEYNLAMTMNDGNEKVLVSPDIPLGAYTLEIKTAVGDQSYVDASDSYFKVVESSATKGASAAIDQSSLKQKTGSFLVTGSATNVSNVGVFLAPSDYQKYGYTSAFITDYDSIAGQIGKGAFSSASSVVANGRWSAPFSWNASPTTLLVLVFDTSSKTLLAQEKLGVGSSEPVVPSVTIDQNSLVDTTGKPEITGTATNLESVSVVVSQTTSAGNSSTITNGPALVTNGRWSWPTPALKDGAYKIAVYGPNGVGYYAQGILTVRLAQTSTPVITVVSPNGGGYWYSGKSAVVEWKTANIPENNQMNILLYNYNTPQAYDLTTSVNDGREEIVLPASIPAGAYLLSINTSVGGQNYMDNSDSYFKVLDNSVTPIPVPVVPTPTPAPVAPTPTPPASVSSEQSAELYAVGVYEASSNHQFCYSTPGQASVKVLNTGKPMILALSSYEPVNWNIVLEPGANVQKVILGGYHVQTVQSLTGATNAIPVSSYTYYTKEGATQGTDPGNGFFYDARNPNAKFYDWVTSSACSEGAAVPAGERVPFKTTGEYYYAYKEGTTEYLRWAGKLKTVTGLDIKGFQGSYSGSTFTVPPASATSASNETTLNNLASSLTAMRQILGGLNAASAR